MKHIRNTYFKQQLDTIKTEIITSIKMLLQNLGGKVCFRYYYEVNIANRNTYFDVDSNGYGRELFIDTAERTSDDKVAMTMYDSEDTVNPLWDIDNLNASEALLMLTELEQIADYCDQHGFPEAVGEYEPDVNHPRINSWACHRANGPAIKPRLISPSERGTAP